MSRTIPSIAELRENQRVKTQHDQRWSYLVFRRISIYLSWLLLHTGVSANQVTVISIVMGVAGLVFLGVGATWATALGLALLLGYHLLDRVDGEIARQRKVFSLRGVYLDNVGHHLTIAGVLIASGYALRDAVDRPTDLMLVAALGGTASGLTRVAKHAPFQLYAQYVRIQPNLLDGIEETTGPLTRASVKEARGTETPPPRGLVSRLVGVVLSWTQFPATLLILAVGLIVAESSDDADAQVVALVGLCAFHGATFIAMEIANLTQNLTHETRRLADRDQL